MRYVAFCGDRATKAAYGFPPLPHPYNDCLSPADAEEGGGVCALYENLQVAPSPEGPAPGTNMGGSPNTEGLSGGICTISAPLFKHAAEALRDQLV